MDRHTAKGSQLSRRDSGLGNVSPTVDASGSVSPEARRVPPGYNVPQGNVNYQAHDAPRIHSQSYSSMGNSHDIPYRGDGSLNVSPGPAMDTYPHESTYTTSMPQDHSQSPATLGHPMNMGRNDASAFSPATASHSYRNPVTTGPAHASFVSQSNVMPFHLPPSGYQGDAQFQNRQGNMSHGDDSQVYGAGNGDYTESNQQQQSNDMELLNQMTMASTVPVFGNDGLNKSPYAGMPEDFLTYLFNNVPPSERSPMSKDMVRMTPTYSK